MDRKDPPPPKDPPPSTPSLSGISHPIPPPPDHTRPPLSVISNDGSRDFDSSPDHHRDVVGGAGRSYKPPSSPRLMNDDGGDNDDDSSFRGGGGMDSSAVSVRSGLTVRTDPGSNVFGSGGGRQGGGGSGSGRRAVGGSRRSGGAGGTGPGRATQRLGGGQPPLPITPPHIRKPSASAPHYSWQQHSRSASSTNLSSPPSGLGPGWYQSLGGGNGGGNGGGARQRSLSAPNMNGIFPSFADHNNTNLLLPHNHPPAPPLFRSNNNNLGVLSPTNLPPEETIAFPSRRRSISTHSDGRGGLDGFLDEVHKLDAEEAQKQRRRAERQHQKQRAAAAAVAAATASASHLAASSAEQQQQQQHQQKKQRRKSRNAYHHRSVSPAEPQRSELTPKQSLVERERQRRQETERARLKRQLALTRHEAEALEEQQSNATGHENNNGGGGGDGIFPNSLQENLNLGSDDVSNHATFMTKDESVAGTVGDGSGSDARSVTVLPPTPKPPSHHHHVVVQGGSDVVGGGDDQGGGALGYAMERFLQDGIVENGDGPPPPVAAPSGGAEVSEGGGAPGSVTRGGLDPTLAPAGIVLVNTSDPRSGGLPVSGMVLPSCGSSASSSLLSDLLARDEDLEEMAAMAAAEQAAIVENGVPAVGGVGVGEAGAKGVLPVMPGASGGDVGSVTSGGNASSTAPPPGGAVLGDLVLHPVTAEKIHSRSASSFSLDSDSEGGVGGDRSDVRDLAAATSLAYGTATTAAVASGMSALAGVGGVVGGVVPRPMKVDKVATVSASAVVAADDDLHHHHPSHPHSRSDVDSSVDDLEVSLPSYSTASTPRDEVLDHIVDDLDDMSSHHHHHSIGDLDDIAAVAGGGQAGAGAGGGSATLLELSRSECSLVVAAGTERRHSDDTDDDDEDDVDGQHHGHMIPHDDVGSATNTMLSVETHPGNRMEEEEAPSLSDSHAPHHRLGRLTEAEIMEMAAIDYASIGNAPANSLRDERLASFSQGTGGSGTIIPTGAFSDRTQTTVQESVSITSAGAGSASLVSGTGGPPSMSHQGPDDEEDDNDGIDIVGRAGVGSSCSAEDLIPTRSSADSAALVLSPGTTSNASVAALPSEAGEREMEGVVDDDDDDRQRQQGEQHHPPMISRGVDTTDLDGEAGAAACLPTDLTRQGSLASSTNSNLGVGGIVNRQIRPGMVGGRARQRASIHKRAVSMPVQPLVVDGFDYDKYDHVPLTSHSGVLSSGTGSSTDGLLPGDMISPGGGIGSGGGGGDSGMMLVSPLQNGKKKISSAAGPPSSNEDMFSIRGANSEDFRNDSSPFDLVDGGGVIGAAQAGAGAVAAGYFVQPPPPPPPPPPDEETGILSAANGIRARDYGAATATTKSEAAMKKMRDLKHEGPLSLANVNHVEDLDGGHDHETRPLMVVGPPPQHGERGVPREVTLGTMDCTSGRGRTRSGRRESVASIVDSVFSSVRSASTDDIEADMNDSDKYLASGMFLRAFPERFLALIVTLLVEIPVLLMISGGSDRLCALIGRRRYQLMMAFLPLSSAISGNCGLQGSTLTTRAVSHLHVTKSSYLRWLWTEVGASFFLGLSMGSVLGLVAYYASEFDFAFGITIFFAQFVSILTAGLTGTLAPLIFTFIFHRDSGKWGGPLETAIQDIVGSFAMVVLSYRLLQLFGPSEVDPSDSCVAA